MVAGCREYLSLKMRKEIAYLINRPLKRSVMPVDSIAPEHSQGISERFTEVIHNRRTVPCVLPPMDVCDIHISKQITALLRRFDRSKNFLIPVLRDIRSEVAALSVGVAEKILRKELSDDVSTDEFLAKMVEEASSSDVRLS